MTQHSNSTNMSYTIFSSEVPKMSDSISYTISCKIWDLISDGLFFNICARICTIKCVNMSINILPV